jgi:hypothetical protein
LNNPQAQRHPSQRIESEKANQSTGKRSGSEDEDEVDDDRQLRRLFRTLLTLDNPSCIPTSEARQLLGTLSASRPRWRHVLAGMQPSEVAGVFDSYARLRDHCDTEDHGTQSQTANDSHAGASPIDVLADAAESASRVPIVHPITPVDSNMGDTSVPASAD